MATPAASRKERQWFATKNPKMKVGRRKFTSAAGVEGDVTTLSGYVIVWNENSTDRGGYVVQLAPGSASFASKVLALFHHDPKCVLGSTSSNTLRILPADDYGVPVEIDLPDTTLGRDLAVSIDRGDIDGMSFAMADGFEDYTESRVGGQDVLTCTAFTVDDVTVTATPAFAGTTVGVKVPADNDYSSKPTNRITASLQLAELRLHTYCRRP